jgi:hypothetical protein
VADDEKTLHIRLSYDGGSGQQPPPPGSSPPPPPTGPTTPTAPPSPQAPATPTGPTAPPPTMPGGGGQGPPRQPPAPPPTVGVPQSPPQVNPGGGGRIPIAPGGATTAAAGGAGSAALAGAVEAAGAALVVVGVVVAALGALATVTNVAVAGMSALADRLSDLDPGIATANATSEVREMMGRMEQAQQLSGEMQGFINQRTTMDLTLQRIETQLTKTFAPVISKLLSVGEEILEWVEIGIGILKGLVTLAQYLDHKFHLDYIRNAIWGPVESLKEKFELWLGIQTNMDVNETDARLQKDLLDALDPHRKDIMDILRGKGGDMNENGQDIPRRFGANGPQDIRG